MSWVYKIFALLMLALWLPVTGHCTLETFQSLDFLDCSTPAPSDSHCENDSCQTVESASYKLQDNHADFAATLFFVGCLIQIEVAENGGGNSLVSTLHSPELPTNWQFILRTALSPRAPSFVS